MKTVPKKYIVSLKDKSNIVPDNNITLDNPNKYTTEDIIDNIVDGGVVENLPSGNIKWYPPHQIESVYFDFDE